MMTSGDSRRTIRGHSFWQEEIAGKPVELLSGTEIELSGDSSRWTVVSPGDPTQRTWVDSASREVRNFFGGVLDEMHRMARRATVRPAPKPSSKSPRRVPANAPVPCPLCGNEAWVDCQLCDGEGFVTQQRSDEWTRQNR